MLELAFRNVFRQKTRTAMTLLAIVFGISGLVLSGGFVRDIYFQLGELLIHSQSGHLQIARNGFFDSGGKSPQSYLIENADEIKRSIASIAAVEESMGRINFAALVNNGRTDWAVIGEGVEPDKEQRLGSHLRLVSGRILSDRDQYGVMVGQGVARALKLAPDDRVTIMLTTQDGSLNSLEFDVVGIFQTFSKDYDARAIRIPLEAASELLANAGVNTIVVSLKHTRDTERAARAAAAAVSRLPVEVRDWKELNDFYEKTVALYDRQFGVLQLIILLMVLLSVSNSINMSIFERVGEFGTMRAVGNRSKLVLALIMSEAAILGAVGSLAGIAAGVVLALIISSIGIPMPPPPNSDLGFTASIQIVPEILLASFLIGFAATVLAALPPALRVTRTPIAEALRHNI